MTKKFRKGQKLICNHYKTKYICVVNDVVDASKTNSGKTEVWVTDDTGMGWWGPVEWFTPLSKKVK